jgi:transposase-like protein
MSQDGKVKTLWQRRQPRCFSEQFKKQKVQEIESKLTTVRQVSKLYGVTRSGVYKWLNKYSVYNKKKVRLILEPMSDTHKIEELQKKIRDLERLVGQKQIELEFKEKMIQIAEEMYGIDIKKKLGSLSSDGSETTPDNKDGK